MIPALIKSSIHAFQLASMKQRYKTHYSGCLPLSYVATALVLWTPWNILSPTTRQSSSTAMPANTTGNRLTFQKMPF
jgi:hypothetical protein